jgi:hypothetical protein
LQKQKKKGCKEEKQPLVYDHHKSTFKTPSSQLLSTATPGEPKQNKKKKKKKEGKERQGKTKRKVVNFARSQPGGS